MGIPIVFILGKIFKKKKPFPSDISIIGILKPVAIGDLTLLSGIIRDLKNVFPFARIIVFSGEDNSILIPHIKGIYKNIIIPIKNPLLSMRLIRDCDLDILIDFCSWPRINAIISFFSKAKYSIGFKTKRQARHFIYDQAIEHQEDIHEIDNYRKLISIFDLKFHHLPKLVLLEEKPLEIQEDNYCVFHLAAGGYKNEYRQWSFENWLDLFKFLKAKNSKVYLLGSKTDYLLNKKFLLYCDKPEGLENLAGKFTFSQNLSIIARARAVISVNTGIMHIAAALKVPTIGLSGPTNINRWGAIGSFGYNICPDVDGCGFLNLGFEYKNQRKDCMKHISSKKVISLLDQLLEEPQFSYKIK